MQIEKNIRNSLINRNAVILINIGTPNKADRISVYKYLKAFLNDKRVIDLPAILRFFLVNFIIIPFRLNKSLGRYRKIWTEKGSPLLFHTLNLKNKLQEAMQGEYDVYACMRYGNPSLKKLFKELEHKNYLKITIFPLFPQFASATSGSVIEKAEKELSHWNIMPIVKIVSQFYDHPGFSGAFAERINACNHERYEHVLFSFHSLPLRNIQRLHPEQDPETCYCTREMPSHGNYCYKAACYETARLIAASAGIAKEKYTVCFQSRLKGKWLSPFTGETIIRKTEEGCKDILVVSPSFVSDCLETIYDIGMEAAELFRKHGGNKIQLVESLNDLDLWVSTIKEIVIGKAI